MKKLPAFLLVLCAVSCSQTKPQNRTSQPTPSFATTGLVATTNATKVVETNAPDNQFNPARTNVTAFIPAENALPIVPAATNAPTATNGPTIMASTSASAAAAQEEIIPAGTINFPATDLKDVLQIYSELVNRTLLRPANLGAPQITLKTQTPLTKKEAIQAFEAVFALNGISLINIGDKFVKVVPAAQANQEGAPNDTRTAAELPDLGQYVTHVVQLKYVKPSEMVPAIAPFAKLNSILPIDPSMILIIRDYTENVKRMLEMVAQIDITVPAEFISEVIPIKYAMAADIADALNSLGAGGGGGGGTVGRSAAGGGAATPRTGASGLNRPGGIGGVGGLGGAGNTPYGGAATPGMVGGGAAGGGTSFTDRLNALVRKASTSGDLQLFGQMKIIADVRSNSLLIFATRQDMDMIKSVIAKLDVVLAQVLIETLIMDVTIGDTWALGVSAVQRQKTLNQNNPNIQTAGGYNNAQQFFNWLNSVGASNAVTTQNLPAGLSYFGKFNDTWDVALQAAAGDNRVKVVQRPRIQTSHATPASLFIGSTVPYVTSTYYGGGYGGTGGNSYQQLKVGIGLNVTPFINQDGLVVMKIDETIDELDGSTPIAGVGDVPNTKSSSLSAEIAVRDKETIILGGIIRNSDNKTSSGVPYLKDIPLLGALFRTTSDTKKRQESIVLMRPTVLRTPELAALQVAEERKHMPGISEAASDTARYEKQMEAKEAKRLKKEQEADKAQEEKYKAQQQKLFNTPDPLVP
jgi:general secretion pathway protein D